MELGDALKTREFLGGYAAGIDDVKRMSTVDIVRVSKGDMRMARMVHYYLHRGRGVSEEYLEGWSQAIGDARKLSRERKETVRVGARERRQGGDRPR